VNQSIRQEIIFKSKDNKKSLVTAPILSAKNDIALKLKAARATGNLVASAARGRHHLID
jgi:hypothetical protein